MSGDTDSVFLAEALELARAGVGQTSPNPAVGALLVKDGAVVGRGSHTWHGLKHAEVLALEEAGPLAAGATCYVTLEPCSHHGRTAPCVDALIKAKIARVVAAMQDPNPLVAGSGFSRLRDAGIEAALDESQRDAAEQLNQAFIHFMRTGRPLVTLKTALTLDGKIAAPDDNRGWITSAQARQHVQMLRHEADAMVTGIGTVLADDCLLTDRTHRPRSRPLLRMVLDSQLRIPLHSKMVTSAESTDGEPDLVIVGTSAASPERRRVLEARGVRVLEFDGRGGRVDLYRAMQWLGEQQRHGILVEAGSKVNWALLEAQLIDRVFIYYAPKILGGTESLPMAGGVGRRRRVDAIRIRDLRIHQITAQEFAVEGRVEKDL